MGSGSRIGLRWKACIFPGVILSILIFSEVVLSQEKLPGLVNIKWLPDTLFYSEKKIRMQFSQELEYSLSANLIYLMNPASFSGSNCIDLLENLKYRWRLSRGNTFVLANRFDHNLGFQFIFDSIPGISMDDNTLSTRFDWNLNRIVSVSFNSTLTTRILNSSFLTPLIWSFSLGTGFHIKKIGTVTLGISSAKLTYLLDHTIFDRRGVDEFFGVPRGEDHLFEFGLGLLVDIRTQLLKIIRWENSTFLFWNRTSPVDLAMNNEFGVRILKYLGIVLRTRVIYDREISRKLQMENLLSLGFYIKV